MELGWFFQEKSLSFSLFVQKKQISKRKDDRCPRGLVACGQRSEGAKSKKRSEREVNEI